MEFINSGSQYTVLYIWDYVCMPASPVCQFDMGSLPYPFRERQRGAAAQDGWLLVVACFFGVIYLFHTLYCIRYHCSVAVLMFRYLDIGLGLVLFSSTLSLVYAGYSESKAWLAVFASGSLAVLVLYWCWAVYNKYVSNDHQEFGDKVNAHWWSIVIVINHEDLAWSCVLLDPAWTYLIPRDWFFMTVS